MVKTAKSLVEGLQSAEIIGTRVRFTIPQHGLLAADLRLHLKTTVIVDFGKGPKFFPMTLYHHELEKKILYQLNPRLRRASLRPKSVRNAMNAFIESLRSAGEKACHEIPESDLQEKARTGLADRDARHRMEEHLRGVQAIRSALMGPAKNMELEELQSIWRECHVEIVMSS